MAVLLFSLILLTQPSPSKQENSTVNAEVQNKITELLDVNETNYRLGPGDVVKIYVDSIPEVSGTYTISETGYITFSTLLSPLIVQGLTIEQLYSALVKALIEYLYEPVVTVNIMEYHSHKVLVLGPFQRPGNFELKREKIPLCLQNYLFSNK